MWAFFFYYCSSNIQSHDHFSCLKFEIYYLSEKNCLQKTSNEDIQISNTYGLRLFAISRYTFIACFAQYSGWHPNSLRTGLWTSPHWSTFLTRSTTGTDVHGIIPSSVMTISTKSGGVTSYTRLSRPSDGTSCQCSSCLFPARVTMRSSGSSEKDL